MKKKLYEMKILLDVIASACDREVIINASLVFISYLDFFIDSRLEELRKKEESEEV